MLTLLLNLTGKFLKICTECHCRDVTELGLSTMIAFDVFLIYTSREGSQNFARMREILFGISM